MWSSYLYVDPKVFDMNALTDPQIREKYVECLNDQTEILVIPETPNDLVPPKPYKMLFSINVIPLQTSSKTLRTHRRFY